MTLVFRKYPLLVVAAIVAIASATMTTTTASAGGATVNHSKTNFDQCTPYSYSHSDSFISYAYSGEYCNAAKGHTQSVTTPSGNTIVHYKEKGSSSANESGWADYPQHDLAYTWESTHSGDYDYKYRFVLKKGQQQVYSWSETFSFANSWSYDYAHEPYDSESQVSCEGVYDYHYANGKVTKTLYSYTCS